MPSEGPSRETPKEACRQAIELAADRLGHTPTKAEYDDLGLTPTARTIARVYGNWNAALEDCGRSPVLKHGHTREDCRQAIREVAERVPDDRTMFNMVYERRRDDAHPSFMTIRSTFDATFAEVRKVVLGADE